MCVCEDSQVRAIEYTPSSPHLYALLHFGRYGSVALKYQTKVKIKEKRKLKSKKRQVSKVRATIEYALSSPHLYALLAILHQKKVFFGQTFSTKTYYGSTVTALINVLVAAIF